MKLTGTKEHLDEICSIYRESFPEDERRTWEHQREKFRRKECQIRVIEKKGKVQAFLVYWILDTCIMIEYLATTQACRGRGYGKQLVQECLEEAADLGKPVFLEIEPITEEDEMTGRRAGFYRRMGFCLNEFEYRQPPLKEGDGWKKLFIMSYGVQMEEQQFLGYREEIYRKVYDQEEM